MAQKVVGAIGVIFGGLFLALELYCLKFMLLMERASGGPYVDSPLSYLGDPGVFLSVLVILAVIITGIVLMAKKERKE